MRLFPISASSRFAAVAVLATFLGTATAAHTQAEGANLPRYASLRHESVHVRAGPGQDYPIRWTYQRQGLPVQVVREYENWRLVRDFEGGEGWVHAGGLTRRRTAIVMGAVRVLRAEPADAAKPVARLEPGVVARLEKCDRAWCRLSVPGYSGWLKQQDLWGVKSGERLD